MNEQQINVFMQAIIADPENDNPRLVLADYLEEYGDPRGEFIRVQCSLEKRNNQIGNLIARQAELLNQFGLSWLPSSLVGTKINTRFRRGFLSAISTNSDFPVTYLDFYVKELVETLRTNTLEFAFEFPNLKVLDLINVNTHKLPNISMFKELEVLAIPSTIICIDFDTNRTHARAIIDRIKIKYRKLKRIIIEEVDISAENLIGDILEDSNVFLNSDAEFSYYWGW